MVRLWPPPSTTGTLCSSLSLLVPTVVPAAAFASLPPDDKFSLMLFPTLSSLSLPCYPGPLPFLLRDFGNFWEINLNGPEKSSFQTQFHYYHEEGLPLQIELFPPFLPSNRKSKPFMLGQINDEI